MAARTSAAQDLDAKMSALLTSLDTYLALSGQTGEPKNAAADYFWAALVSQLVARSRMEPLILRNRRDIGAYSAAARPTNTVEARDPFA